MVKRSVEKSFGGTSILEDLYAWCGDKGGVLEIYYLIKNKVSADSATFDDAISILEQLKARFGEIVGGVDSNEFEDEILKLLRLTAQKHNELPKGEIDTARQNVRYDILFGETTARLAGLDTWCKAHGGIEEIYRLIVGTLHGLFKETSKDFSKATVLLSKLETEFASELGVEKFNEKILELLKREKAAALDTAEKL